MISFTPFDWFWIVGGDASRAWSSAVAAYVNSYPTDKLTRIANETELSEVLAKYGLNGPVALASDVDKERNRRIALIQYDGHEFEGDAVSLRRIDTAKTNALAAIINGSQPGDLRWADPNIDFVWISHNNASVPMDAQGMLSFGLAAAAWEGRHILKARALKNMSPIPISYADDSYWT